MATITQVMGRYNCERDEYLMQNGSVVSGYKVRWYLQKERDRQDASRGYDPYNNFGRKARCRRFDLVVDDILSDTAR